MLTVMGLWELFLISMTASTMHLMDASKKVATSSLYGYELGMY